MIDEKQRLLDLAAKESERRNAAPQEELPSAEPLTYTSDREKLIAAASAEASRRNEPIDLRDWGFRHVTADDVAQLQERAGTSRGVNANMGMVPVIGAGFELSDQLDLFKAALARRSGVADRDQELRLLQEWIDQGRPQGFWEGFGEMGLNMLSIMSELGAAGFTGGAAGGALAARFAARQGFKSAAAKMMEAGGRILGTATTAAGMRELGGRLVGPGGSATLNSFRRALPDLEVSDDDAAALAEMSDRHFAEEFLPMALERHPLMKGLAEDAISAGVEQAAGPLLGRLTPFAALRGAHLAILKKMGVKNAEDVVAALENRLGFSDGLTELAEEVIQGAAVEGTFGDGRLGERLLSGVPGTWTEAAQIVLLGTVTPAVAGALQTAFRARDEARTRAIAEQERAPGAVGDAGQVETSTGGDAISAGEATAATAGVEPVVSPEVRARDVAAFERDASAAAGRPVEFELVEPESQAELWAAEFARRKGVAAGFVRTQDPTDLPRGFTPGGGRALFLAGAPGLEAVAVHEAMHTWQAQQTPEALAELDAELGAIDQDFLGRVQSYWESVSPLQGADAATTQAETQATAAEILAPLVAYLDTPRGAADFAKVYTETPGLLRRTLEAIWQWIADYLRVLPDTARRKAQGRLDALRGDMEVADAPRLASRILDALDEIRPAVEQGPAAAREATAASQASTATSVLFPGGLNLNVGQTSITAEAEEGVSLRPAGRVDRRPPMPGDKVMLLRRDANLESVVLDTTFTPEGARLRIRVGPGGNFGVASRNRQMRNARERTVLQNEVRLLERADPEAMDPTSRILKNRRKAEAAYAARAAAANPSPQGNQDQPEQLAQRRAVAQARPSSMPSKKAMVDAFQDAARLQSRYQGNKAQFLRRNAEWLADQVRGFDGQLEQIHDIYQGGSTYGLSLAASGMLPGLKKVTVNEIDPDRRLRLEYALKEGPAFLEEWNRDPLLKELLGELRKVRKGMRSNSPVADTLSAVSGSDKRKGVRAPYFTKYHDRFRSLGGRQKAAFMGLLDSMFGDRTGTVESALKKSAEDASRVKQHADAAKARGVAVAVSGLDSLSPEAAAMTQRGGSSLVLLDPPYYKTAQGEYRDGSGSTVHLGGKEFLQANIQAAARMAPGNLVIYHNKHDDGKDVQRLLLDAFGKSTVLHTWRRNKAGQAAAQAEITGAINGYGQGNDVGVRVRSQEGAASQGRAATDGDRGVLGGSRGDRRGATDARAGSRSGGPRRERPWVASPRFAQPFSQSAAAQFGLAAPLHVHTSFSEEATLHGFIDQANKRLSDEFLAVDRFQKAAKALGASMSANPESAVRRFFGKISDRAERVLNGFTKPLEKLLADSGITLTEAGDYVYARHAPEANQAFLEQWQRREDLVAMRARMKKAMRGQSRLQSAEQDLRRLEKLIADLDNVKVRIPDGVTPQEFFHEVRPMSGMKTSEAQAVQQKAEASAQGKAYRTLGRMVDEFNRKTRDRMLSDGLLSPEQHAEYAEKFRHYVPLRTAEVDSPGHPTRGAGFSIRGPESKRRKGRGSKADNPIVFSIQQALRAIERGEKNQVGQEFLRFIQDNRHLFEFPQRDLEPGADIQAELKGTEFHVKVGGRDVAINVKDQELANALRRTEVARIPRGLRVYAAAQGVWRGLVTTFSPEFVATNAFKDVQAALFNVQSVSEQFDAHGLRRSTAKGMLAARKAVMDRARGREDSTGLGARLDEYLREGGRIGTFTSPDFEAQAKAIERGVKRATSKAPWDVAMRSVMPALDYIEDVNQSVETMARFSLYNALRDRGVSPADAAYAARQLTTDFSQKGTWGSMMSLFYVFASASIGGNRRMAQELLRSKKSRAMAAALVGYGAAQAFLNEMLSEDDDDGMSVYSKLSEFEKTRNHIIMLPGMSEPLKIPLPYGYSLFVNAGRLAAEFSMGRKTGGEASRALLLESFSTFQPFGASPTFAQLAAPTALDPFVQSYENTNFAGSPIRPMSNPFGPDMANHRRANRDVWDASTAVAKAINWATGGDDVEAGLVNPGGDDIEHFLEFFGGGTARFATRSGKAVAEMLSGDFDAEDLQVAPFVRLVYGSRTEFTDQSRFYESMDEIAVMQQRIKDAQADGDREKVDELRRRHADALRLERRGKRVREKVKALKDQAYEKGSKSKPDEKLMDEAFGLMREWVRDYYIAAGKLEPQ